MANAHDPWGTALHPVHHVCHQRHASPGHCRVVQSGTKAVLEVADGTLPIPKPFHGRHSHAMPPRIRGRFRDIQTQTDAPSERDTPETPASRRTPQLPPHMMKLSLNQGLQCCSVLGLTVADSGSRVCCARLCMALDIRNPLYLPLTPPPPRDLL